MTTPVILDCDPGHDDVFAIWLAAAHPAIDLRAITTVAGNGSLAHTTLNARIACTVAGIHDVPIAAGADRPLEGELHVAADIHGANALGGPALPEPDVALDDRSAVELMRDVLTEASEPVTIVPTGPLTNVATLLRQHPELLARIARIVWMGGSTGRGNSTPYAEFNAWTDPEAVHETIASGVDVTMVGLNISHQALVTADVRERVRATGTRTGAFGFELMEFFCAAYAQVEGMPDAPLHDPITVAMVADPAVATMVRTRVDVELTGTHTRGATSADLLGVVPGERNANVALDLDVDRFWSMIVDAVAALR
ncbi:nucleoside hydrolase [Microbacterium fluvii]|uniref:Nucleoside hydrolase n=1 Tax=Microbacterium fluvii TaxID=415215 RepID=A0ABW2HEE1_9MICO|nr:nucleoside hydrolase [Microbacterium fluvii]MCU4673115.1 nucleoside hydrolase [Microbacterium fluvii]